MVPAPRGRRIAAYLLDALLAGLLAGAVQLLLGIPGWPLMPLYILGRDGLPGGRSLGKRALGLKVMHLGAQRPCTLLDSVMRSSVYLIPLFGFVEAVVFFTHPEGRRLGDQWSQTLVVRA